MMIDRKEVRFGKIIEGEETSGLPVIEILTVHVTGEKGEEYGEILNKNEEITNVKYLSPFRGYKFQVSGSAGGCGDYGSSQVIGLANINYISSTESFSPYCSNLRFERAIAELLKGQAMIAVCDYAKRCNLIALDPFDSNFDEFCQLSYKWLKDITFKHANGIAS